MVTMSSGQSIIGRMCHPEVPAGQPMPDVDRSEVSIPLASGERLPGLLARPRDGEGPGVLIANDVFGRTPFYENLAARLAAAGCVALDVEFFFRLESVDPANREAAFARRAKLDEQQAVRELSQALDWLKQQPGVRGDRLGTIGFCMGGTFVLNLAAERRDLATVCFYGFPAGAPQRSSGGPIAPLSQVDQVSGPILAFWGDQDEGVGMHNVAAYAAALRERHVDFEHVIYPGLGHGFLAASRLDPDNAAYEMACDAWTRTIAFYRRHLAVPAVA
jgi:carboxymethylenebutenolidase